MIAKCVARYGGPLQIRAKGQTADASSMLDLMSLGLEEGSTATIEGPRAAVDAVAELFESNFPE